MYNNSKRYEYHVNNQQHIVEPVIDITNIKIYYDILDNYFFKDDVGKPTPARTDLVGRGVIKL